MMDLLFSVIFMMVASFIIQYTIMSIIMTNSFENIFSSLGKIYMSTIMALLMGLVEVIMNDYSMKIVSTNYYIVLGGFLLFFVYIYKNQILIDDKEYLSEMIEHHSMALLTSNKILEKTNNSEVKKLAENIVNSQTNEIEIMKNLLKKM